MDIKITETKKVGDGMGAYIVYQIVCKVSYCLYTGIWYTKYQLNHTKIV